MGWRQLFRVIFPLLLLPSMTVSTPIDALAPRSITPDLFGSLALYAQYSAAAYCPTNNDSPSDPLRCPPPPNTSGPATNCPLVEAANTITTSEFQHTFLTDDTGYVALSHSTSTIVLAFRGSVAVQNFLSDIAFPFAPTPVCKDCYVHGGFLTAWREIRSVVLAAINDALAKHPNYALVCTGHSLGGALASLACADLRNQGHTAALYTFGSPRVGNEAWAQYVSNQAGGNFRVTHRDDPVPRLGPLVFGFRHISPEYYITKGDDTVSANDIKQLDGTVNIWGNTGTFGLDINAHLHYLGPITACGSGLFSYKN